MSEDESYHSLDDGYDSPLLGSRLPHANNHYTNGNITSVSCPSVVILEPPNSYRSRWRSLRIMYLTMFMGSVTFTITVSSLWPFLQELDPSTTPSFLGWVVAAYSLGQLVASPFFGGWANFRKSSREPLTASLVLTVLFNVLYMYLQSIHDKPQIFMIVARGLVGFSAGSTAVVRSYISAATTLKERTACMANVSIFQALGFILGPVIQTCLVPLHFPGPVEFPSLHINMYTAPAMFASILAFINLLLVVFVFKEHQVDGLEEAGVASHIQKPDDDQEEDEAARAGSNGHAHAINGEDTPLLDSAEENKPDMIAVLSTIFLFFVILFMFTVFETIGTPLTMHMYAWTKTEATLYQGIILGCSAATSIVVFVVVKILAKKFNERYLLLAGLVISFGAFILFIPWGPGMPPLPFVPTEKNGTITPNHLETFGNLNDESVSNSVSSEQDHDILTFAPLSRGQNRMHPNKVAFLKHMAQGNETHIFDQNPLNVSPIGEASVSLDIRHKRDSNVLHKGWTSKNAQTLERVGSRYSHQLAVESKAAITDTHGESQHQTSKDSKLISKLSNMVSFDSDNNLLNTKLNVQFVSTKPAFTTTNTTSLKPPANSSSSNVTISTTTTSTSTTIKTSTTTTTSPPTTTATSSSNVTVSPEGCPWQYSWCRHVPALPLLQYLAAILVFSIGYPMCQMLSYTIYSKILGSMPQGVWMGWITAAGSLARTVGPIYVSQVYDMSGPQATFGSVAGLIFLTTIFYVVVFRRLVPCQERKEQTNGSAGSYTQQPA
ncbi:major facilitator superfamily domain-containing protein 8 [Elysia marginata]|uniref:Major facilitator superfamily domain-containing protein 8 n=1 Tax=Elysia marginata TaxID=1093978 RepID=A0AAV4FGK8_9GAST|nr:major facilitator superfamily domain-containing protein 8 [Elysia marginata]